MFSGREGAQRDEHADVADHRGDPDEAAEGPLEAGAGEPPGPLVGAGQETGEAEDRVEQHDDLDHVRAPPHLIGRGEELAHVRGSLAGQVEAVDQPVREAVVACGGTQRARHDDQREQRDEGARCEPERALERLELDDPLDAAPGERRLEPCVQRP